MNRCEYQLETLANSSQKATCVPAKTFADKPKDKSEFEKLSTQLKQLDKAIESHENKQNKRKIDRERVLQKIESMLPEGYGICLTGGVSEYPESLEEGEGVAEFGPEEVVVGSVWECVSKEADPDGFQDCTVGNQYTVIEDKWCALFFLDDAGDDVEIIDREGDFKQCFKRMS